MTGVKARVFRPTVNISLEDLVPADHFYTHHYRADVARCNACRIKAKCTTSEEGRTIRGSFFQEYLERVAAYYQTQAYKKAYRKRKVWVEPLFGEAQQWHGLKRFRLRGLVKVNCEAVLTATGQNLKRLLAACGWGRRWFPNEAAGVLAALTDDLIGATNGRQVLQLSFDNHPAGHGTPRFSLEPGLSFWYISIPE